MVRLLELKRTHEDGEDVLQLETADNQLYVTVSEFMYPPGGVFCLSIDEARQLAHALLAYAEHAPHQPV
jgi:hypothetical protein